MVKGLSGQHLFGACLALTLGATTTAYGEARAEDGPEIDAAIVMERINEKYEELHAQSRRVTMKFRTITREEGKPDVEVTGTAVALQKDRKIRFEQAEDEVQVEAPHNENGEQRQAGDLLWIHDGRLLWSRYEEAGVEPDSDCGVREFYLDHDRIPAEFGPKWTRPMMAAELPDEFLEHDFTLEKSVLDGEPVYVLRSIGRIPLSPENAMGVTLWVDPETYLVVRMESEASWNPSPDTEADPKAYVDGEYDISYDFGIPAPDSIFEIEISDRAEDITDVISQKIWEKLKWQGKLPESMATPPAPDVEMEQREWRCPPIG